MFSFKYFYLIPILIGYEVAIFSNNHLQLYGSK